ncbi:MULTISPECIES: proline dehydrogenase family protein [Aneurinibacillus]|uniref:proline dehydrogenase n=1 Tax=Aneurinibacillus thermoaerophilus TaxID=143495 RepID=A0A1G8EH08_ANETH|nr:MULTISPECIES: proline dehydrogenase [Aneurinibacillus]AMA74601.1 proline dehydrogenase [Aneurinibacillus sp. XH2]MED0681414.1 proline dehydrogenase [Aneurinibacillus thermoaerophilus]MED0736380.1 proline dehydrogenase [Aneurinibacillus thermoaerophilus]MED0755874.1 proline dehydrogenase [Aneurinibacillus thermoaerophilus]MED0759802.1 proline dehydrogenase [Aneurinibacillus thermoaerophilus]
MAIVETAMKNFFLFLSQNKPLNQAAKKWGLRFGASRFVAGETIREAINKVRDLNNKGLVCTLDHLGEFVFSREEAIEAADYCVKTLEAIHEAGVDSNLSLKLTQIGLDIDLDLCRRNMHRILYTAKKYGNFVRIDMEDYGHCQQTLDLLKELRQEYDNVGTVIQAYLYRTEKDIEDLKGVSLRLVKGAYKESPEVAYPDKKDVDENYKKIIKKHLLNGSYTAIASHDDQIISYTKQLVKEYNIPRDQFEFQMLYGIRTQSQIELAQEGYKMRVYVPYGNDWYGYFMRRLAERPANVAFVLKGMVSK